MIGKIISIVMGWLASKLDWDMSSTDNESYVKIAPVSDSTPAPNPLSIPKETTPSEANRATLEALCLAIRDFEGGPGDKNYKNNNPGNCRFYKGGYLPIYLPILKDKDGFAIFKNMETGMLYLRNMLKAQIHANPSWTILDMMTRYAPENDNNPTLNYAKFVAKRLSVDISYKVKNLL